MFILNKDCNDVYNTDHIVNIYQDPNEIRADARKTFLRTLRTTLDMEMLTCSLDGESIQPFIDDIKRILAEYDK